MASTLSLTPSLPSSFDTLAGTSAYDIRVVRAFVYSLFAVRSNSFLRTGSGANNPVRVIVVPLYLISCISYNGQLTYRPSDFSCTIDHPPIFAELDDSSERCCFFGSSDDCHAIT